jgi:hypothetical protein
VAQLLVDAPISRRAGAGPDLEDAAFAAFGQQLPEVELGDSDLGQ